MRCPWEALCQYGGGVPAIAVELHDVGVRRLDHETGKPTDLLIDISWQIRPGQRWIVMGPNGAGKSTLLDLVAATAHPTAGRLTVLGEEVGAVNLQVLRQRIGHVPADAADTWRERPMSVADVVRTGWRSTIALVGPPMTEVAEGRVQAVLALVGLLPIADRRFSLLSRGERQRTQIARAILNNPSLIVLDEPAVGLDLAGREHLLATLDTMAAAAPTRAGVMVTHHLEEVPTSATHALFLVNGRIVASGPIADVLTADTLDRVFGIRVQIERRGGRVSAIGATVIHSAG